LKAAGMLAAMTHADPNFPLIHLLFALVRHWFGFWTHGKPPASLVRAMERAEHTLADAIRATLREDGWAFPALDDRAFLKWFAKNCPGSDNQPIPGTRRSRGSGTHCYPLRKWAKANGQTGDGKTLDPRLPAGLLIAGLQPAFHDARAPP
jgi:hypothetical protein